MESFRLMMVLLSLLVGCQGQSGEDTENQPVQIGFSPTEYTVREEDREVTVTVTVLQGSLGNETLATVMLHTEDGSAKAVEDYEPLSNHTLTFSATNHTHNVTIVIIEDDIDEETEMFHVRLSTHQNSREIKRNSFFDFIFPKAGITIAANTSNVVDRGLEFGLAVGLGIGLPVLAISGPVVGGVLIYCKYIKKSKVSPVWH